MDDVALFMKRYQKGLKKQGYTVVRRKFPNKKKRLCYNYEHLIAKCPYEIKENKYKRDKKESKHKHKRVIGRWEKLTLAMHGIQP